MYELITTTPLEVLHVLYEDVPIGGVAGYLGRWEAYPWGDPKDHWERAPKARWFVKYEDAVKHVSDAFLERLGSDEPETELLKRWNNRLCYEQKRLLDIQDLNGGS